MLWGGSSEREGLKRRRHKELLLCVCVEFSAHIEHNAASPAPALPTFALETPRAAVKRCVIRRPATTGADMGANDLIA
jgi:hypothetical protein